MCNPVGRNLSASHELRTAKIVPLKQSETFLAGLLVFPQVLHFLRNQNRGGATQTIKQLLPLCRACLEKIHLNVVCQLHHGSELWVPGEIVKGDAVTQGLEFEA